MPQQEQILAVNAPGISHAKSRQIAPADQFADSILVDAQKLCDLTGFQNGRQIPAILGGDIQIEHRLYHLSCAVCGAMCRNPARHKETRFAHNFIGLLRGNLIILIAVVKNTEGTGRKGDIDAIGS